MAYIYKNGAWQPNGKIYRQSKNLMNPENIMLNTAFEQSPTPSFMESTVFNCSNYIPVVPGKTYLRIYNNESLGNYIYIFDNNKNFISQMTPGSGSPILIPNGVGFVVFNISNTYDYDYYMFAETSNVIPFEPYGVTDWYDNAGHKYSGGAWS